LKEKVIEKGGNELVGVRIEMMTVDKTGIEMFAYGTGIKP
jgi:uncharacterized protein YbjQ (UPF0145 family)